MTTFFSWRQGIARGVVSGLVGSAFLFGPIVARAQSLGTINVETPRTISRSVLVGRTDGAQVLHIAVSLPPRDLAGLQSFADSVSDPANANYRHFLTPAEVGSRFGATTQDVNQVVNYLKANGFTITLVAPSHFAVLATATVAQAEAAFHTTINNYHALAPMKGERSSYFAFSSPLQTPWPVATKILDVTGLSNAYKAVPLLSRGHTATAKLAKQGQAGQTLTPTQARTLYNLAPIYGAGYTGTSRTVGISNFDGFDLTNVPLFYNQFGLPKPRAGVGSNITVITIDGGSETGPAAGEGDLDIQMALGEAPLCSLRIYDGSDSEVDVLTLEASDNLVDAVSESYGWIQDPSGALAAHNVHLQMSVQGITYMVAAGDNGTLLEPYSYPDYEPECLLVGGSVATVAASGLRQSEVAWSGGGGGWATDSVSFNVLPPWQHGKGVPTGINYRLVPDVALHADGVYEGYDDCAYWFYFQGSLEPVAGTSCASPLFTGALVDSEQDLIAQGKLTAISGKYRLGRMNNMVYAQNGLSSVWYDITLGSNGTLPNGSTSVAGPNWDFTTGWGSINWQGFVNTFTGTGSSTTVLPSTVAIYAGQGYNASGGVAQLDAVDKSYYMQKAVVVANQGVVNAAQIGFTTTTSATNMTSLIVNVVANGPSGSTNFIYLYDYLTNTYDVVSSTANTGLDQTITVLVPNFARYVSPSNKVLMINRMVMPLRIGLAPYTMRLDLATLTEGTAGGT